MRLRVSVQNSDSATLPNTNTVGLLEWGNGFLLGRLTQVRTVQDYFCLRRSKKLRRVQGKLCHWVVDYGEFDANNNPLPPKRRFPLDAKTEAKAKEETSIIRQAFHAPLPEPCAGKRLTPQEEDIRNARLKVQAQVFPSTVKMLRKAETATSEAERVALQEQAEAEYKAEGFAWTGILLDGTADEETRERMKNALRRKPRGFNRVDYELALNWKAKGYNNMKPPNLADAVNAVCLATLTAAAMKQRRLRLGLVSLRNEGCPQRLP